MGSGFAPIEPDVKAFLLNATGGGLTSQLFLNSSIGAGAQGLVTGILGLDPANVPDQFSIALNFTQSIVDPADGLNEAEAAPRPRRRLAAQRAPGRGLRRPGRAEPGQRGARGGERPPALRSVRAEPAPERVHPAGRGDPGDDPRQRRRRRDRRAPAERSGDARGQHRHRRPARSPSCRSSRIPRSTRSTAASRRSSAASGCPTPASSTPCSTGSPTSWRTARPEPSASPARRTSTRSRTPTCRRAPRPTPSSRAPSNAGGAAPFAEPTPDVTVSFISQRRLVARHRRPLDPGRRRRRRATPTCRRARSAPSARPASCRSS